MLTEARESLEADYALAIAKCLNLKSPAARAACLKQARKDGKECLEVAREHLDAGVAVLRSPGRRGLRPGHTAGNVWYFGEISKQDENGELVSLEGSWQAGVGGAKAAIVMEAHPAVGDTYRQEFSLGVAEDMSSVLDLNESAAVPSGAFNDCLKTEDFTAIAPDAIENKFFSATVDQVVLTVDTTTGDREELVQVIGP